MKKKNLERWLFNHEDEIEELEGKVLALEEQVERLDKKLTKIAAYFHGTCHPYIKQIDKIIND